MKGFVTELVYLSLLVEGRDTSRTMNPAYVYLHFLQCLKDFSYESLSFSLLELSHIFSCFKVGRYIEIYSFPDIFLSYLSFVYSKPMDFCALVVYPVIC